MSQSRPETEKEIHMEVDKIVSLYKQFLRLTENSLESLKNEDYSRLVELTNRRFEVYRRASENETELSSEVGELITQIIEYENEIIELAKKKKNVIEDEFRTLNNKGKIAKAYRF